MIKKNKKGTKRCWGREEERKNRGAVGVSIILFYSFI
jgi:hypothetical protein